MKTIKQLTNITDRNAYGMSLATTLCLGVVSTLWVSSMLATVMPAYQKSTVSKVKCIARNSAETALDMVISDLNSNFDPSLGASVSPYDSPTAGSVKRSSVNIPTIQGLANHSAEVFVYNRFPTNTSSVFDSNLASDPNSQRYYRIVEARARVGNVQKTVRAVLEPRFQQGGSGIQFPFAGFGDQGLTVVGRVHVSSYNPNESADPVKDKLNASLGSNVNTGHVGQNYYNYMSIGGDQYEFPNPVSTQTQQMQNISTQFNAQLVSQAKWCQYFGNVYSNGSSTAHYPAGPSHFNLPATASPYAATGNHPSPDNGGWRNVRGLGNTEGGSWQGGKVEAYMDYQKIELPPAPTSPAGARNLGSVNMQNSSQVIFRPGATPSISGSVGTRTSGTVVLPPGDYVASSVTLSGNSRLVVEPGAHVNLYLEGTSGGTNIMTVSKNASFNNGTGANAQNLRVYSNSSKDMVMNGNTRGLIYAPNARVMVGSGANGSGSDSFDIPGFNASGYGGVTNMDFWGSAVGRELYFLANPQDANSAVRVHYDRSLITPGTQYLRRGAGRNRLFQGGQRTFYGWRAISYQEDPAALP